MKYRRCSVIIGLCLIAMASHAMAQATAPAKDYSNSPVVTRLMAFDANHDGKLTREEVTDARLHRLFDLADTKHEGVVTKEQLMALAAQLDKEYPARSGRGGPGGPGGFDEGGFGGPVGPDGFGGPGGRRGAGGRGFGRGPGGFGGPPQPGQVLPPMLQDQLNLSAEQKQRVAELQKEIDAKLAKILTEQQLKQMKEMRPPGPGGRGRNGGPPPPPDEQP